MKREVVKYDLRAFGQAIKAARKDVLKSEMIGKPSV